MRPLLHAFLAGLPLALVVAPLFYVAGAAPRLILVGAALAFGIGAAFELLSTNAFWARGLGGIVTVAVAFGVAGSWADMSRLALGVEPDQDPGTGSRVEARGARVPIQPLRGTTGAQRQRTDGTRSPEAGYSQKPGAPGGARSATGTRSTGSVGSTERAPSRGDPGSTGATGSVDTPAAAEPQRGEPSLASAVEPLPLGPEPATNADQQTDGVPTTLRIRNGLDVPVEVTVVRPGLDGATLRLEPGDEAQVDIGAADPSRARISWRYDGSAGSVAWSTATRSGAVFVLPGG